MSAGAEAAKKTVLVVDDDSPVRALCRVSLEKAGFRVLEAADGDGALASVHAERPDLILLDIMMPRVSGWQVASELLSEPSADEIPIVFISVHEGLSDRIRAFELGVQDYVPKPFDPDALVKTICTVLDEIERGERSAAVADTLAALKAEQALAQSTGAADDRA